MQTTISSQYQVVIPKPAGEHLDLKPKQKLTISDHQQSWGYEDGPWKGPGPPLLVAADF